MSEKHFFNKSLTVHHSSLIMKFGVIVFPGSNCDHDAYHVISKHVGQPVDFVWHKETDLSSYDAVIVPGGFSYGDYLRCGALAKFSPVMTAVKDFAAQGKFVFGICNGFQILCEAGLLPGALIRNANLHFICKHVNLKVENNHTPYTSEINAGEVLSIPIAHAAVASPPATAEPTIQPRRPVTRSMIRTSRAVPAAAYRGSRATWFTDWIIGGPPSGR